jgi:hypothetical protein
MAAPASVDIKNLQGKWVIVSSINFYYASRRPRDLRSSVDTLFCAGETIDYIVLTQHRIKHYPILPTLSSLYKASDG